jgi:hypothetical protein
MSSVGFTSQSNDHELEKLREAWKLLNDLLKNLSNAEACLKNLDLKLTGDHIKVAKWNVEQVKKVITFVGQSRNQKGQQLS